MSDMRGVQQEDQFLHVPINNLGVVKLERLGSNVKVKVKLGSSASAALLVLHSAVT